MTCQSVVKSQKWQTNKHNYYSFNVRKLPPILLNGAILFRF
nr:MAG TPA: hypothetical protein [Caudoviricetes sp.]